MFNILLIILGLAALFFLFVLVSIYKDYRINKKLDKKSNGSQKTSKEVEELRGRVRNATGSPWNRGKK
jgi:hypothetical protein